MTERTMNDLKELVHLENIPEPPKQWRNRWKVLVHNSSGMKPGEIYDGAKVHPSKEIAEQRALDEKAALDRKQGVQSSGYIGAFPVTP